MKAQSHSLFHPTTLTMLSGFATIIATTIALGSMELDQSGQAAAVVSKSFRTELEPKMKTSVSFQSPTKLHNINRRQRSD